MQNTIKVLIVAVTSVAFTSQAKADAAAVEAARSVILSRKGDKIVESKSRTYATDAKSDSQSLEDRQARMSAELEKVKMDRAAARYSEASSAPSVSGRDDAATATRGVSVKDRAAAWGKKTETAPTRAATDTGADEYTPSVRSRAAAWEKKPANVPTADLLGLDEPMPAPQKSKPIVVNDDLAQLADGMNAEAKAKKQKDMLLAAELEAEEGYKSNEVKLAKKKAKEIAAAAAREEKADKRLQKKAEKLAKIETQKAAGAKIRAGRIAATAEEGALQEAAFQQLSGSSRKAAVETQSGTAEHPSALTEEAEVQKAHHKETAYERKERMKKANKGGRGGKGHGTGVGHG